MTTATAVQLVLNKDAKPADLAKLIDVLVGGADDQKPNDDAKNEYSDDWTWGEET